jgi:hypothetical protein
MRKHIILFFSALLFLFACKNEDDASGIIKQDKMVHLLADVHLTDGSLAEQIGGDSLFKYGTGKYLYLFKQYHTDSAQFKKSMKYYTTHPDVLSKMYADIGALLQVKYDSLNKITTSDAEKTRRAMLEADKRRADSIKKSSKFKNALPRK